MWSGLAVELCNANATIILNMNARAHGHRESNRIHNTFLKTPTNLCWDCWGADVLPARRGKTVDCSIVCIFMKWNQCTKKYVITRTCAHECAIQGMHPHTHTYITYVNRHTPYNTYNYSVCNVCAKTIICIRTHIYIYI